MDERLRRMEEAYLRMEENNRRIQSQYDTLLKKYDDLSRKVTTEGPEKPVQRSILRGGLMTRTGPPASSTPGRQLADMLGVEESAPDPLPVSLSSMPPAIEPLQEPGGSSGTAGRGRGSPMQPSRPRLSEMVEEGDAGRGLVTEEAPSISPLPSRTQPFRSRMDRIGAGAEGTGGRTSPSQQPAARDREEGETKEGEGAEGKSIRDLKPRRHKGEFEFAEGLEFNSLDGEFKLQFHDLTQAELRAFPVSQTGILSTQFFIPRQRWYFVGDLTKNVGFYTAINRGYGSLDQLDAFLTLRFSNQVRLRFGRMKTPYLYEYFSIAEGDLIAPERSLFATNLALNRQMGAMLLGDLFEGRMNYATGLFNGPRRSFQDFNSAKDFAGIVTFRPFLKSERYKALNYLNVGGTWDVGYEQNYPPQPVYFETANDQTAGTSALGLSPAFLHLNNNVQEYGERIQWGGHVVWYWNSFFLMGEYGGIKEGFGHLNSKNSVPVDFNGWHVTASYFLTGEQVTRRVNMVKPLRDFNFNFLKPGEKFSPGAVEVFARYSALDISQNMFTGGFADPNLWSSHVHEVDVGLNWYLNFYTRVYLDWNFDAYSTPIVSGPGRFSSTTDLFWLRLQVFF